MTNVHTCRSRAPLSHGACSVFRTGVVCWRDRSAGEGVCGVVQGAMHQVVTATYEHLRTAAGDVPGRLPSRLPAEPRTEGAFSRSG